MFHDFTGTAYGKMRQYAGLSVDEVAAALGRSRQTILRLEANQRKVMLKREQEQKLVEITRVTRPVFGNIMCETLTPFIGRRVMMAPSEHYTPSFDLLRAIKLYARHQYKLDLENREYIEGTLAEARNLDATAERMARMVAKEIVRRVNAARVAWGEDPSSDVED